jgi:hypothetical protein
MTHFLPEDFTSAIRKYNVEIWLPNTQISQVPPPPHNSSNGTPW